MTSSTRADSSDSDQNVPTAEPVDRSTVPKRRRKPESPTDLTKRSLKYVGRKTVREFRKDECQDVAAALTYYAVLSLFPAVIALLALVGVVGQGRETVDAVLEILRQLGAGPMANTLEPTLAKLSDASGAAGMALAAGLATALWSASGYIASFSRAMNRVYGVPEGRPFWKLRPLLLLVTLVAVVMAALVALALVLTGDVARTVGDVIGLGGTAVQVWSIAKWPVILGVVVMIVAILYYVTPNVKQPRFRWISPGALVAIGVWVAASAGFGFYVSHFGSYNKTYGTLAGAVIFLLWLWLTNMALLFGAELDSELERGRELQAGLPAEKELQLPLRDTRNAEKAEEKDREDLERAREVRQQASEPESGGPSGTDRPKESVHAR